MAAGVAGRFTHSRDKHTSIYPTILPGAYVSQAEIKENKCKGFNMSKTMDFETVASK